MRYAIDEDEEEEEEYENAFLRSLDGGDEDEGDDSFDAAAWLNGQLDAASAPSGSSSAAAPLSSLEASLSSLLTKTSVARADLTDAMDEEMRRASQNVPRIATEVGWIARNVTGVKTKLEGIGDAEGRTRVNGSAKESDPLAHLADIYTVHSQLASYRTLLRLASSWSTLSSDVSLLLSDAVSSESSVASALANLSSASMRLKEAQDSLNVFGDSKEGKEKAELLARLIDSFEAAVRSQLVTLVKAVSRGGAESAPLPNEQLENIKAYSVILSRVGRRTTFERIWRLTRIAPIQEHWQRARVTEDGVNEPAATPLLLFLPTFLAELPALLSSERIYASELFGEHAVAALDAILDMALQQLDPTLGARISRMQVHHNRTALLEAIKVVRQVRERGGELERVLARAATTVAASQAAADENHDAPSSPVRQRKGSDAASQSGDAGAQTSPMARRRSLNRRMSRDHGSAFKRQSVHLENGGGPVSPTTTRGHHSTSYESVEAREQPAAPTPPQLAFSFTHTLYSSLSPIHDAYAQSEAQLFSHLWEQEKRTLPAGAKANGDSSSGGLGDEQFRDTLDKLQRSWTIIADLSEDAVARCLELTRGSRAAAVLTIIDAHAASVLTDAAREVEATCRKIWDGLIYSQSPVPSGREWTAYGRVASLVKGLKRLSQRVGDLHTTLVAELKESAGILAGAAGNEKALADVAEKLTKLHGVNGAGVRGSIPSKAEVGLMLSNKVAMVAEEKQAREAILSSSLATVTRKSSLPSASSSSSSTSPHLLPDTPLLPLTSAALTSVLSPVLHSLLVLPLVPMFSALTHYGGLAHWSAATLPGQVANEYQLSMPSFSLGPTETMQSVGEGVLGLVRELESWIVDEGVAFGLGVLTTKTAPLSEADVAAAKKERRRTSMMPEASAATTATSSQSPATSPKEHRRRSSLMPIGASGADSVSPQPMATSTSPLDMSPPHSRRDTSDGSPGVAADMLPSYLALLLRLLTGQIAKAVLPHLPPRSEISPAGWKQLEADVDYLERIIGALAVDGASLSGWRDAVGSAPRNGYAEAVYGYKSALGGGGDIPPPHPHSRLQHDSPQSRSQTPPPGTNRLETVSLRQMLQSQRRGANGTPRSDSPVQRSGGGAQRKDGETNSAYTVDFNAMNVGMGW